ncbi:MAG: response regulator transcription factor [Christensenellales bacterium]|jgi:two-component system alkaline phosphatase synthesis response regulator PhoP|nr:response regulator transcription factor [Clostridiales bacterium]MEE1441057.1 response regulator transcription factor [Christensenellales bacterium]
MATIMIYEPNEIIAQKLCDSLKKEKYNAIRCDENVIPSFSDDSIPLVMMDAQLRWTTCRPLLEAFQKHGCPILFLTGDRKMSAHLRALYGGRSDVLTVPFSQKALHAKVHNALGECAPLRELSVDEKERVALLDGRRVELTAQEFALLLALMEKPDIPVSREQLLRRAWGYQSMGETRTVDVHVQRLRKKLGGEYIETVYKCGYRLKLA